MLIDFNVTSLWKVYAWHFMFNQLNERTPFVTFIDPSIAPLNKPPIPYTIIQLIKLN
jgi:hypothetical protein